MEKLNILISMQPKSWWWKKDWIPSYPDNPSMEKWYKPDAEIVKKEYDWLIESLQITTKANIIQVLFPSKELEIIKKISQIQEYSKKEVNINPFVKNPNWSDLIDNDWEFTQHDFVFVRDSFISNQSDKIIISNFTQSTRKIEELIINEILNNILNENNIDRKIINPPKNLNLEWWDFRLIPKDQILFAWIGRNSLEWIKFVQNEFNIDNKKLLIIDWNWFHVDTYFSVATNNEWELIAWIICWDLVKNMDEVKKFFKDNKKMLIEIPSSYWIWINWDWKWNFATNSLQLWEYMIWCNYFSDNVEKILENEWVKRIVTPMTQYMKSWWAVHCSTNQI